MVLNFAQIIPNKHFKRINKSEFVKRISESVIKNDTYGNAKFTNLTMFEDYKNYIRMIYVPSKMK